MREKELKEQLSKAERLLKLGELCRKLEREREKVLPFHTLDEAVPIPALPAYQAVQASKKASGALETCLTEHVEGTLESTHVVEDAFPWIRPYDASCPLLYVSLHTIAIMRATFPRVMLIGVEEA